MSAADSNLMRIGELARRTGMAEAALRTWERRYGIPRPQRTVGGHRLYSEQDVVRLARIQRLVEQGWAVGSAARRVGRELGGAGAVAVVTHRPADTADLSGRLTDAFDRFDAAGAHSALDEAFRVQSVPEALDELVVPTAATLQSALGADQPAGAAAAHFGLALIRSRLAGLLADLTAAAGDPAVVCAVQGEACDVDALVYAIPLAQAGWVVRYLGADVPPSAVTAAATVVGAKVIVAVASNATTAKRFLDQTSVPTGMVLLLAGHGFASVGTLPTGTFRLDETATTMADAVRRRSDPVRQ